jgi:phosphatidylserine/phosphatidylglycerophosphate/cardiolipin synthase-like enzyme
VAPVRIRGYCSPTVILLAFDWDGGAGRDDFLGFAISRTPGLRNEPTSWLPNRLGFDGPARDRDLDSSQAPIQKFAWWDARIDDEDRGKTFTYTCTPVVGSPDRCEMLADEAGTIELVLPRYVENGIGTWFNRAVVSSQAFSRKFGGKLDDETRLGEALSWLANGLEQVIPEFLKSGDRHEGAIYHFTDRHWLVPALESHDGTFSMVYNNTRKDTANEDTVETLSRKRNMEFTERTKAAIMHNKFIVGFENGQAKRVLMGSANFTTSGLATQANLLHTFESPELADLYLRRKQLLEDDPTIGATAQEAGWSDPVTVGDAKVCAFFPPEPKGSRESLDRIVNAVKAAEKSVYFCLFSPTDRKLRDAIFRKADEGAVMLGLVNKIGDRDGAAKGEDAGSMARVELYHRSRDNKDVYAHSLFPREGGPEGLWFERSTLPGMGSKFPVYVHHKFVLIDAETDHPVIFTGSANMSSNALYRNDENLLEIRDSPRLAAIYLAEFLRLYEHYRARAAWSRRQADADRPHDTFKLTPDASWARKYYVEDSPEFKSRVNLSVAV